MLFWVYMLIVVWIAVLLVMELFGERNWRRQVALSLLLIPFVLRILQLK